MSIELPILSIAPDFTTRPTVGPTAVQDTVANNAALGYSVFPEPARAVLNAQYRTVTVAEQRAIDRVFHSTLGMAGILYAPSWHPEFEIIGPLDTLDWSVLISGTTYEEDNLTGDRWSTLGRYVWIYRYSTGELFGTKVLDVTIESEGQRLHLDDPLPWAGPAKDFAGGFLYLARFNEDTLRANCALPGHCEYNITLRQTFGRPINARYDISGVDQYGFLRLEGQWVNDYDFTRTSRKVNPTVGPEILRVQQDTVFVDPWVAWVSNYGIRLKKASSVNPPADTEGVPSIFYQNLGYVPQHLSLAFDHDAYEVFAIQKTDTLIEIKRWQNGAETTHQFNGWSPVLWYDGILQVDESLRDVVCLYLPEPDSYHLKARFQRDNFNTEYAIAELERKVYFLTDADTANDRFYLHGITIDGNVTSIYSIDYPPAPVEAQETLLNGFSGLVGVYAGDVVPATPPPDTLTQALLFVDGTYVPITVEAIPNPDTLTQGLIYVDGAAYEVSVLADVDPETLTQALLFVGGETIQIAIPISLTDSLINALIFDGGTYETP